MTVQTPKDIPVGTRVRVMKKTPGFPHCSVGDTYKIDRICEVFGNVFATRENDGQVIMTKPDWLCSFCRFICPGIVERTN